MKVLFEFEYDDKKLGKGWFNIFNLELSLFSEKHTRKELLKVKEIKDIKSLVEIDKEGVLDAFIHSIPKKGLPNMKRVAKFIVKENPIKLKERK